MRLLAFILLCASPAGALGTRAAKDRSDDVPGYQVHAMYVLPQDGVDMNLDINGRIATSVATFNAWFKNKTGNQNLRLDTYKGALDVTFYRLKRTDKEIRASGDFVRDRVQDELEAAGFKDPKKIYAVYYGGSSSVSCGGGAHPPELIGHVAALYLNGEPPGARPCNGNSLGQGSQPEYLEFAMIHEIVHTLGFAVSCGRHFHNDHTNADPADLMYAGDKNWEPATLDARHDDYFRHGIEGCLDLADSVFLTPSTKKAAPPPGWQ